MRQIDIERAAALIERIPADVLITGERDRMLATVPELRAIPGADLMLEALLSSLGSMSPPSAPSYRWTGAPWPVPRSMKSDALKAAGGNEVDALTLLTNRRMGRAWRRDELARLVAGGKSVGAARRYLERRQRKPIQPTL